MKLVSFDALTFESASRVADQFYGYHINLLAKNRKGVIIIQLNEITKKLSIPDIYNGIEYKS